MLIEESAQDTSRAASARYFELLRSRTMSERAAILAGLNQSVRRLAEISIRTKHPAASEREARARLAARLYGASVASQLFPDVALT